MKIMADEVQKPTASEIPQGSIIIGTHIIDLQALNDENLDAALKSAEKKQQNKVYYKSELANGVWYDVTNANSIEDITVSSGKAVSNDIIDQLPLTHWTKKDGTTIEFATGRIVSMDEISALTDPNNMEELEEINRERNLQKQKLVRNKYDTALGRRCSSMDRLFGTIEGVEDISAKTKDFEEFVQYVRNTKKAADEVVQLAEKLKQKWVAKRDIVSYRVELGRLNQEINNMEQVQEQALVEKYNKAVEQIQMKIETLENESGGEPAATLDQLRGEYEQTAADSVFSTRFDNAYGELLKVYAIENIQNNIIQDKTIELAILQEAQTRILSNLGKQLNQGDSEEYQQGKAKGEPAAVLENIKKGTITAYQLLLNEMESILQYKIQRTDGEENQIQEKVNVRDQYVAFADTLPSAAVQPETYQLLMDKINVLNAEIAKGKAEQSPAYQEQKAKKDALDSQLDELNDAYVEAAEEGDLEKLSSLKRQMEGITDQLKAEEAANADQYKKLSDEKDRIEKALENAAGARRKELSDALADVQIQLAISESLMEKKAQDFLRMKETAQNQLNQAIEENDTEEAQKQIGQLKEVLESFPNELLSSNDIEQLKQELTGLAREQSNKMLELGESGLAAQMESIGDQIGDAMDEAAAAQEALQSSDDKGAPSDGQRISQEEQKYTEEEQSQLADKGKAIENHRSDVEMVSPTQIIFVDLNIKFTEPPLVKDDSILVPGRKIFEALGASVTWRGNVNRVVVQGPYRLLEFTIDSPIVYYNDKKEQMSTDAICIDGVTYIPLQYIVDKYNMGYEEKDGYTWIYSK